MFASFRLDPVPRPPILLSAVRQLPNLLVTAALLCSLGRPGSAQEATDSTAAADSAKVLSDRALAAFESEPPEYRRSIELWSSSVELYRRVGDDVAEATALHGLSRALSRVEMADSALACLALERSIRRTVGDKAREAETLDNSGLVFMNDKQPDSALVYFEQALAMQRELDDGEAEAATLQHIGAMHGNVKEYELAIEYLGQAMALQRALGDREGEALSLQVTGMAYGGLQEMDSAAVYLTRSAELYAELGEVKMAENSRGILQFYRAAFAKLHREEAEAELEAKRRAGDRSGEAAILRDIGMSHAMFAAFDSALFYYRRALAIERELGDSETYRETATRVRKLEKILGVPDTTSTRKRR